MSQGNGLTWKEEDVGTEEEEERWKWENEAESHSLPCEGHCIYFIQTTPSAFVLSSPFLLFFSSAFNHFSSLKVYLFNYAYAPPFHWLRILYLFPPKKNIYFPQEKPIIHAFNQPNTN